MIHIRQPSTAFIGAFLALLSLAGCGGSGSDASSSASSTVSGTSSGSTTAPGSGTATGPAGSVTLNWEPPSENTNGTEATQLIGYYVYYGTNPDELTQWVVSWGAQTSSFVVENLAPGTYYFSVRAYNWLGIESAPSATVSVTI
jgi:hypothetical protein